jgi:hypothetical protein
MCHGKDTKNRNCDTGAKLRSLSNTPAIITDGSLRSNKLNNNKKQNRANNSNRRDNKKRNTAFISDTFVDNNAGRNASCDNDL